MEVVIWAGIITALGTAALTVASVWKLLTAPITKALSRLEGKVDAIESRHQSDIKDIWKHLAERSEK